MRRYYKPQKRYTFIAEDSFGDYDNGNPRTGHKNSDGYVRHNCIVLCCQGKRERHRNSRWRYASI